jgi:hypothetical protein
MRSGETYAVLPRSAIDEAFAELDSALDFYRDAVALHRAVRRREVRDLAKAARANKPVGEVI